jgi:GNAT superfamily N-acetyltransferase
MNSMPEPARLVLSHHSSAELDGLRDELLDVHADANAEFLHLPFFAVEAFWKRLQGYSGGLNFDLVAGRIDGQLVGYAFGSTLPADTAWWSAGLQDAKDPDVTRETGTRTYAFREFLVRRAFQGHGHGRRLHDELLSGRPEERATLLVRPDNPARELYLRWGWTTVGRIKPGPEFPDYEAMVLPLAGRDLKKQGSR